MRTPTATAANRALACNAKAAPSSPCASIAPTIALISSAAMPLPARRTALAPSWSRHGQCTMLSKVFCATSQTA